MNNTKQKTQLAPLHNVNGKTVRFRSVGTDYKSVQIGMVMREISTPANTYREIRNGKWADCSRKMNRIIRNQLEA